MRLDGVELLSEFSAFLAVFFFLASTCRESLLDNWSSTLRDTHLDQAPSRGYSVAKKYKSCICLPEEIHK